MELENYQFETLSKNLQSSFDRLNEFLTYIGEITAKYKFDLLNENNMKSIMDLLMNMANILNYLNQKEIARREKIDALKAQIDDINLIKKNASEIIDIFKDNSDFDGYGKLEQYKSEMEEKVNACEDMLDEYKNKKILLNEEVLKMKLKEQNF